MIIVVSGEKKKVKDNLTLPELIEQENVEMPSSRSEIDGYEPASGFNRRTAGAPETSAQYVDGASLRTSAPHGRFRGGWGARNSS